MTFICLLEYISILRKYYISLVTHYCEVCHKLVNITLCVIRVFVLKLNFGIIVSYIVNVSCDTRSHCSETFLPSNFNPFKRGISRFWSTVLTY